MVQTVDALKLVFVALGGDSDDYDAVTIPDALVLIAGVIPDAIAQEMPKVTGSNDGQVLTVVSGKWKNADVPKELPTVSATDNGSVLKVVDGAWAVGEDATE